MDYSSKLHKSTDWRIKEIMKPILYADVFDYPLTLEEVHKFLEFKMSVADVKLQLDTAVEANKIIRTNDFYSLSNKPDLAHIRLERNQAAREIWPKAMHYGRIIATLPFVRMVAITGSLAVSNPLDLF